MANHFLTIPHFKNLIFLLIQPIIFLLKTPNILTKIKNFIHDELAS